MSISIKKEKHHIHANIHTVENKEEEVLKLKMDFFLSIFMESVYSIYIWKGNGVTAITVFCYGRLYIKRQHYHCSWLNNNNNSQQFSIFNSFGGINFKSDFFLEFTGFFLFYSYS